MQPPQTDINKYGFLICLMIVAILYLPVTYMGFVNMDDGELFDRFLSSPYVVDFQKLFFPERAGRYFRPILTLSFYLDSRIWGMSVQGYHFFNYLFHLFNASLVYFIALQLIRPAKNNRFYAGMAMLIFGLHPLTCESVAWVSGRSDVLGTFFFLAALAFYFTKSSLRYVLVPGVLLMGLLSKENALAGLPIIVLFDCLLSVHSKKSFTAGFKSVLAWSVLMAVTLAAYLFLRNGGWQQVAHHSFSAPAPKAVSTSKTIEGTPLFFLFPAIGFYFKKLVMPFPLNFAISSISTWLYTCFLTVLCAFNMVWLFKRKIIPVFWSLILFVSFVPALPVALGKIAWVPLAERYLYLSCSLSGLALVSLVQWLDRKKGFREKQRSLFFIVIILVFSVSTFNRQSVWKNSRQLWTDTLKKNPESSMVLFKYGQAFSGETRVDAYRKALAGGKYFKYKDLALLGLAEYEMDQKNIQSAMDYIDQALAVKKSYSNLYKSALILSSIGQPVEPVELNAAEQALEYYQKAYQKKKSAFLLYRMGVILQQSKKREEARNIFRKLLSRHPGTKYAGYAEKHLNKFSF